MATREVNIPVSEWPLVTIADTIVNITLDWYEHTNKG